MLSESDRIFPPEFISIEDSFAELRACRESLETANKELRAALDLREERYGMD